MQKALEALSHWISIHWLFTSLGGGTLMAAVMAIVVDAPIALALPVGALIALAIVVVIKAIPAISAERSLALAKTDYLAGAAADRAQYRRETLALGRGFISDYSGDHSHKSQLETLLKNEGFLRVRKHLSPSFEKMLAFQGIAIIDIKNLGEPHLMSYFARELDRLEKDWNLD